MSTSNWVIYAGIGVVTYIVYKTLFKKKSNKSKTLFKKEKSNKSKFVHEYYEYDIDDAKSNDYIVDYNKLYMLLISGYIRHISIDNVPLDIYKLCCTYFGSIKKYAINPWDEIPIYCSKYGPSSIKPETIFSVFDKFVNNNPNSIYLNKEYLRNNEYFWKSWKRKEVYNIISQTARSFISFGLNQWETVLITGFTSQYYIFTELGAIYAGLIVGGVYTTNNSKQFAEIAQYTKCGALVVDNKKQLQKCLSVTQHLPNLKIIIVWNMDENDISQFLAESSQNQIRSSKTLNIMSWDKFILSGNHKLNKCNFQNEMNKRIKQIKPGQCCLLMISLNKELEISMISHDNIIFTTNAICQHIYSKNINFNASQSHSIVSYLPLSHIAAQIFDIFLPISLCAQYKKCKSFKIWFARRDALKGTLIKTMKDAQPTIFIGVPRVYEKIHDKINMRMRLNPNVTVNYKEFVGFDRLQLAVNPVAGIMPMQDNMLKFWGSCGIDIVEGYGKKENTGMHALGYGNKYGNAVIPLIGVETLILNDGEICMKGRHIMMGYMNDEIKTKKVIDANGYLHSGDKGILNTKYNKLILTITERSNF